ncbi:MAG: hypothetical protein ACRYFS_13710 [Janthinobacterium lividum]
MNTPLEKLAKVGSAYLPVVPEANAGRIARYETLLQVCGEAFADGSYDTAYHALAAAMHCAQDLGDRERLEAVEALADEQMERIDLVAPNYHHSTQSAAGRGNQSLLSTLARQAHTQVVLLRYPKRSAS